MSTRSGTVLAICIVGLFLWTLNLADKAERPDDPLVPAPPLMSVSPGARSPEMSVPQSIRSDPGDDGRISVAQLEEAAAREAPVYEVAGIVRDDAGLAVSGCEVVLRFDGGGGRVVADSVGRFRFQPVGSAVVELFVANSASREVISTMDTHRLSSPDKPGWGALRVDLSQSQGEEITLTLLRAAFIQGRLVDSNLRPLQNITVRSEHKLRQRAAVGSEVQTAKSGRFMLRVFPGTSTLFVTGRITPGQTEVVSMTIPDLHILPGERRNLGDLQPDVMERGVKITGRIVDSEGVGMSGFSLSLIDSAGSIHGTTRTRSQGQFEFRDIRPDAYEIIETEDPLSLWRYPVSLTRKSGGVNLGVVTWSGD